MTLTSRDALRGMLLASLLAGVLLTSLLAAACNAPPERVDSLGTTERVDILGTAENVYSQHGEEVVIRDFFQDRPGGVFLDVGAAWPVHYNNTYYLEKELGWTGVAVDALEEHARRWRNRRPASQFFTYIVTDHSGAVETFYRTKDGELIGVSRVNRERGLVDAEDFVEVHVPTTTLDDLLEEAGVDRLDLLSMDIEGHELTALAAFDIERYRPELVCIEVHSRARDPVTAYFESHGYRRLEEYEAFDIANYYFTPIETR